jgi:hypothetical protein
MINLQDLTTSQLNRIIALKEKIETLQGEIASIVNGGGEAPVPVEKVKRRRMSAAARKRIAAGARARWAKVKGTADKPAKNGKNRLSAAGRAAIIAGTKARWAKLRGETATPEAPKKRDRRSSPAVRAKLAAAAKARWAKVKADGQTRL